MNESFEIYRDAIDLFHAAIRQVGGDPVSNVELIFENTDTFTQVIICCLEGIPEFLMTILGCKGEYVVIKSRIGKRVWPKVKRSTKLFLEDTIYLLRHLTESSILILAMQSIQPLLSLFMILRNLRKPIIKSVIALWSRDVLQLQLCSYMFIKKIILWTHENLFSYMLKYLYKDFIAHSRFFSEQNEIQIGFMKESLIEIILDNMPHTRQFAFDCIKQLAGQVRNVVVSKNSDSIQNVYSWQCVQTLELWCRVFSCALWKSDPKWSELIFPLIELTKGTISLNPIAKFYPLRFRLLHSLNQISYATCCFIPLAHLLLEPLDYISEISHFTKITIKPPNFDKVIKVNKQLLKTLPYVDFILNTCFELVLEHLACYENSIAFPEMAFVLNKEFRKFVKLCKNTKHRNQIKSLIEKIEQQTDFITNQRLSIKFGPSETDKVHEWQNSVGNTQHLLRDYLKLWRASERSDVNYNNFQITSQTNVKNPFKKEVRSITQKFSNSKTKKRDANGSKLLKGVRNGGYDEDNNDDENGGSDDDDDDVDDDDYMSGGSVSKLRLEDWKD